MVGAPSFYEMGRRAAEAESRQKIAELDGECQRLELRRAGSYHRLEMLQLKAENARLRGDNQGAARLNVEAMSLKIELEDIERQIIATTEQLEAAKSSLGASPMLPFWFLPIA